MDTSQAAKLTLNGDDAQQPLKSPYCRELRSKRYFFLQRMPVVESDILDSTRSCWCRMTMQVIGPDGARAHPSLCASGRGCYKSAL